MPVPRRVFRPSEWTADFPERKRLAEKEAREVEEAAVTNVDVGVLAAAIVDECAAQPPRVLLGDMWSERHEQQLAGVGSEGQDNRLVVTYHAPIAGAGELLADKGLCNYSGTGHGRGNRYALSIVVEIAPEHVEDPDLAEKLRHSLESWKAAMVDEASRASDAVYAHRDDVRNTVVSILLSRRRRLELVHAATAAANINLEPREQREVLAIPVRPRELTLEQVELTAETGGSEYKLSDDIAASLIRTISSFGRALERLPRTADKLAGEDEETLRDVLLFLMNANWKGLATGETFINIGKSDILLRWRDRDAFIAECKFWQGTAAFSDAVDQLLGRYVVWRDTRVAIVLFVRDRADISAAIEKAHDVLRLHASTLDAPAPPEDIVAPCDYVMRSATDERRALTLTLIPVIIPRPS